MTNWIFLYLPLFFLGLVLGSFYFGGLWFTVRRIAGNEHPAAMMIGSFILRNVIAVAGFYLGMAEEWPRLIAILLGFILIRIILIRYVKKEMSSTAYNDGVSKKSSPAGEDSGEGNLND